MAANVSGNSNWAATAAAASATASVVSIEENPPPGAGRQRSGRISRKLAATVMSFASR